MKFLLYDSLSRKKKEFVPINPQNVRIYACGPTVYNYAHIGNARMSVVTDLLVNVLKTKYKIVNFASNITDVDDKIIEVAKKEKKKINEISSKYLKVYNEDMKNIGVNIPNFQPKATDFILDMIKMIENLLDNNCAYVSDGNVLFDVSKYKYYGSLSKRSKHEQISGNRIEIAGYKKNPEDFVLWKPSKKSEPGWNSPWGLGRPGWHIECSVMSEKCLGIPFDIHCGGVDLTFPHHENEIAQSCSNHVKNQKPTNFSKYWFHNGFVTVNGEKMSKSLGNFILVNELLKNYSGSVIRYSLLTSHYRQPLDWSEKILEQSKNTFKRFKTILEDNPIDELNKKNERVNFYYKIFLEELYNDLNTPKALAKLNKLFDLIKTKKSESKYISLSIKKCLAVLGIKINKSITKNRVENTKEVKVVEDLINEREKARKNKDFEKADKIRNDLEEMNILIEDTKTGTKWKKND